MKRAIEWFARNPVAANLLMGVLLAAGLLAIPSLPRKVFPDVGLDVLKVDVAYRGAAPAEVESAVCTRVEEAIQSLAAIEKLRSTSVEGACSVQAELVRGADVDRALADLKSAVDVIDTFPDEVEKPVISHVVVRYPVTELAVWGDVDYATLRAVAQQVRDDLARVPGISQVELHGAPAHEIAIEVSELELRRFGLTFEQVASAVRRSSIDLPGGTIRSPDGEIVLRGRRQAYTAAAFEQLVVLAAPDGSRVPLGEVARVSDGFEESDQSARFDGAPAVLVRVKRVGDQDAVEISNAVQRFVADAASGLPAGVHLTAWLDATSSLRSRIQILLDNGRQGFFLMILVLSLFLRPRLAFWVAFGVPTALLGALGLFPLFGLSIDPISVFAFILVLGFLDDDAVVVGESIFEHQAPGRDPTDAAVAGAHAVSTPQLFGVLTSTAAFAPLLFIPGPLGQIFGLIAAVVILCLLVSLVETQLLLPAHLAHVREMRPGSELLLVLVPLLLLAPPAAAIAGAAVIAVLLWSGRLDALAMRFARLRGGIASGLDAWSRRRFAPFVRRCIRRRYLTLACAVACACVVVGWVAGGRIPFLFFPSIESDNVIVSLTMPAGSSADVTARAVRRIEAAVRPLAAELDPANAPPGESIVRAVFAAVGQQPLGDMRAQGSFSTASAGGRAGHLGEVSVQLSPAETRSASTGEIANRWRELVGPIEDAVEVKFGSALFKVGAAIAVRLEADDMEMLRAAVDETCAALGRYPGVHDVADTFRQGKEEIRISLLPAAEPLGLSFLDVARQVRQAFHGEEAQRIQRGRDDVRVMVRYPREQRTTTAHLEQLRIRTRDGAEVPFRTVARTTAARGDFAIQREDRRRVVEVTADVDTAAANASEVVADLTGRVLPEILARHPGVTFSLAGEQREQRAMLARVVTVFGVALLAIYGLLAIPLRSYAEPLLVMSAIPFGLVGAVAGHVIMRQELSTMSVFGLVSLAGLVVNASLVLVDYANQRRAAGALAPDAVVEASVARLRPILVTMLTTFFGLTPLMFDRSMQAKFLIPAAVSLAWGILFATVIALVLVPCGFVVIEDLRRRIVNHTGAVRDGSPSPAVPPHVV